ncbi:TPA: hypothetical protein NJF89_000557 [Pseudomonas aeruginosa]|uniref:hypothetical protein n=1 Tax=Pseudomonas aeruginosa TaxID=287 RepID=UPI00249F1A58|nr:hypothetical protein [Pseudomonas aeruginosa]MDP5978723.1 hypothetical protein [Pseudomonas aeruginosa]MEB5099032.1 hypothetical protein [Pseudomonas aeruginosa]MEB5119276.1 hypothetical protein [Pseudomonas aeruginosa]HBO8401376.1 hypothetical protein [Pseudomonas aeruginosa]
MEIIQQLQALFNSGYSMVVAVAAIVTILFKILAQLFRALEWHNKYLVRKRLIRLKDIRSSTSSSQLIHYLDGAIELEIFRIASGVSTSRSKMEYLLQLGQTGFWSREQLHSLSKFLILELGSATPSLTVTLLDRLGAWAGGISAFSTLVLGAMYFIKLMLTGEPLMWLLGLLLFGLSVVAGRFLATDLIDYIIVTRAQHYLQHATLPVAML